MRHFARAIATGATGVLIAGLLTFVGAGTALADPSANSWYQLRMCESSNRYNINTGNGYYGAYQFDLATWKSVGGTGYPHEASPSEQDYRALSLYRMRGWQPWTCARIVGLTEDGDAKSKVLPPKPGNLPASNTSGGGSAGSTSGNAPAWPGQQYYEGQYSEDLKLWQKQAGKLGYGLVGTGYFGPKTKAAVLKIQRLHDLNVVGFIGPETWNAVWAKQPNLPSGSTNPTPSDSCPIGAKKAPEWPGVQFFYGDSSAVLACFQKQLGTRGYPLTGTGYYGDLTQAAVLDLQRRNGINDSGIIGPLTWVAAWEGKAKK